MSLALWCSAGDAAGQTVGGGWDLLYRIDGVQPGGHYGQAVDRAGDVDGDGVGDFICGAPSADAGGLVDAGVAYVYSGATGALLWRFDGPTNLACLGNSVSGAGDVNGDGHADLLVGAPCADSSVGINEGAVFVYSGADGSILYRFNGLNNFDGFGDAVDGEGDVNRDGVPDFLVGAPYTDVRGPSCGSFYVYSGATGLLLLSADGLAGRELGDSVSFCGDLDLDAIDDIIIGAPGANANGVQNSGSALVLSGGSGSVLYRLDNPVKGLLGRGSSIDGAGDCNGDGVPDLLLGTPFSEPHGVNVAGTVGMVSGRSGQGLWTRQGEMDATLGWSVSGVADLDGDGLRDAVASAFGRGWVYLLRGVEGGTIWRLPVDTTSGDEGAVAGLDDLDGDGYPEILVGDAGADPGGMTDAGSLFVFRHRAFLWMAPATLSVAAGGSVSFTLDFAADQGGRPYQVLTSGTGTGPTWVGGVQVPLTVDNFFVRSRDGVYPQFATGFTGTLDPAGDATAVLAPAPGQFPAGLIGTKFYFAAVAGPQPGRWSVSSMAVSLSIMP